MLLARLPASMSILWSDSRSERMLDGVASGMAPVSGFGANYRLSEEVVPEIAVPVANVRDADSSTKFERVSVEAVNSRAFSVIDRSEWGSPEVYERVGPSRHTYFIGMQKHKALPSGSVMANSRSPQV
jgi:hypothetical protein